MNGHLYINELAKVNDLLTGKLDIIECFYTAQERRQVESGFIPLIETLSAIGIYTGKTANSFTVLIKLKGKDSMDLLCRSVIAAKDLNEAHLRCFSDQIPSAASQVPEGTYTLTHRQFVAYVTELFVVSMHKHFDFDLELKSAQVFIPQPVFRTIESGKTPSAGCVLTETTFGQYQRSVVSAGLLVDGNLTVLCHFQCD